MDISKIIKFFDLQGIASILGIDVKYVYIGVAVMIIMAILMCIRRATKIGVTLFIIGFLIVAIGPTLNGFLESNGVSYHNKQLTIANGSETVNIDLSLIRSYEAEEVGENTKITVFFKDDSKQEFTVPRITAVIVKRIIKVGGKVVEAGENAANSIASKQTATAASSG